MIRFPLAALGSILALSIAVPLSADEPAGFQQRLFNGQDLAGWKVTGCEAVVENGLLLIKSGDGLVRSASRYRDFVLELDYRSRLKEKYDAGIYIRCELPPEGKPWPTKHQVNLKQGDELNLNGFQKARSTGLAKPGEWNHVKLTVFGDKVAMEINGQKAWETDGLEAKDGYIGLQAEVPGGGQFEFKDIAVTEIGYQSLFDGKSLAGWEGAGMPADTCWEVKDGTIMCTGSKGPWLRSLAEHGDFNLRFEYKVLAGGNSGVFIRVPKGGNHHGDGAGIEVQVLDDTAERYRKLKPYQYTGSLYAIAPATEHVGLAPGQWNSLEINCHGTTYRVIHNGVTIIDVDERSYPALAGRLKKGFLGLQNHSEEVWFRNVRIGPAYDTPAPAPVPLDPAKLQAILATPILDEGTPQREVEKFCEDRVVRLPAVDALERKSPEAWLKYTDALREKTLQNVVYRGEAARWRDAECKVEWADTIDGGEGYRIKKLRYEALPGLWIPGLLYEPTKQGGKAPVFLNVNGHDGKGKVADYKQIRCINLARRGIIALNLEWIGMGQLRSPGFGHQKINSIDLCGTSGVATHFLAMKRGLDILLAHPNADDKRVGVAGLSGGGWQTIFFSSLEPRVTLANPVAGYSSFLTRIHNYSDLGDAEQTPVDLGATADYAHLTAMLAPRVALLTYNEKDNCCFAAPHALPPLLEATRPVYQLLEISDRLHNHINYDPGNHNFERDNREALYKVIGQHWYAGDGSFSATEIECAGEVKTADQLAVDLPADNLDLQQIAMKMAANLPRIAPTPDNGKLDVRGWQQTSRDRLRQVLRIDSPAGATLKAEEVAHEAAGITQVTRWKLRLGDEWTIPAIELVRGEPKSTSIVIADGGRSTAAVEIEGLLNEGRRVVAIDPFYLGESKIKNKDWLFALLVSSVGQRPLGVQSQQLHRIADWLKTGRKLGEVRLSAAGPRSSLLALAAAASDEKIDGVRATGSWGSLKELLESGESSTKLPEAFCFGLLEETDIAQLTMLVAPREVQFVQPSGRLQADAAGLASWYQQFGKTFDPLAQ